MIEAAESLVIDKAEMPVLLDWQFFEFENDKTNKQKAAPIVCLHGWGVGAEVWQLLIATLRSHADVYTVTLPGFGGQSSHVFDYQNENLLMEIERGLPGQCHLLGWSLGGMIACELGAKSPKVISVAALACNKRFAADTQWPWAMGAETFQVFVQNFQDKPEKTRRRFLALQCLGDNDSKRCSQLMQTMNVKCEDIATWKSALLLLGDIDLHESIMTMHSQNKKLGFWFGDQDALVPCEAAKQLKVGYESFVELEIHTLAGVGHILPFDIDGVLGFELSQFFTVDNKHLSYLQGNDEKSCHQLAGAHNKSTLSVKHLAVNDGLPEPGLEGLSFIPSLESKAPKHDFFLDKKKIAKSFSRAAQKYDSVAEIQRRIGYRLIELWADKPKQTSEGPILDLGCGTGYFTGLLHDKLQLQSGCDENNNQMSSSESSGSNYQDVIGLDLAEGMLSYARDRWLDDKENSDGKAPLQWLAADAEALPLTQASISLLYSSLAIQWCQKTGKLFSEIKRVLKPGSMALIATLGPETLDELRQSWAEVDDSPHVNEFTPKGEILSAINAAGFSNVEIVEESIELEFASVKELNYELKTLGAHNMNAGQAGGLLSRKKLKILLSAYEKHRKQKPVNHKAELSCESKSDLRPCVESYLPATYQVYYLLLTA